MKTIAAIVTAAALFFGAASESQANFSPFAFFTQSRVQVIATVSVSQQQMFLEVKEGGETKTALIWKVSTGRKGLDTPQGSFNPTWLDANHKSDEYEDAPMLITRALRFRARTKRSKLWAVRGIDLEIGKGECVGVIGRNGSGKSR